MSDHDTALGLVETRGLIGALEAADAMVKAASVRLVRIEKTVPAMMTVQVVGETAAVRSAVDAGRAAAERVGEVISTHVIARPSEELRSLQKLRPISPSGDRRGPQPKATRSTVPRKAPRAKAAPSSDLAAMTVRELRNLARSMTGLPIQGREIARANKAELLAAIGSAGHR